MKIIKNILILPAAILLAGGCDSYRDVHKKYIDEGETVYLRKIDSAAVYSGRDRLMLKIWYTDADMFTHSMVYWNNGEKSMEVPLNDMPHGESSIEVVMPDMPEGAYDLKIHNVNRYGQTSLFTDVFGVSYGNEYESFLSNRQIRNIQTLSEHEFKIDWMLGNEQLEFCEVEYEGRDGTVNVPRDEQSSTLSPLPADWKFRYRSVFKPDKDAIDMFYTGWAEAEVAKPYEVEADYSTFIVMDKKYSNGVNSADCTGLADLWNRPLAPVTEPRSHLASFVTAVPWDASFSVGDGMVWTRIVLWQYGWLPYDDDILYNGGNARTYEFYGSDQPNDDGSLDDSWTLFLTAEITRPSGNDSGMTELDRDVALNSGHEFTVPEGTPAYKYIRMKCVNSFSGGNEWGHSTKMQIYRKFGQ